MRAGVSEGGAGGGRGLTQGVEVVQRLKPAGGEDEWDERRSERCLKSFKKEGQKLAFCCLASRGRQEWLQNDYK